MNPAIISGAWAALKPMNRPIYPPKLNNAGINARITALDQN